MDRRISPAGPKKLWGPEPSPVFFGANTQGSEEGAWGKLQRLIQARVSQHFACSTAAGMRVGLGLAERLL